MSRLPQAPLLLDDASCSYVEHILECTKVEGSLVPHEVEGCTSSWSAVHVVEIS